MELPYQLFKNTAFSILYIVLICINTKFVLNSNVSLGRNSMQREVNFGFCESDSDCLSTSFLSRNKKKSIFIKCQLTIAIKRLVDLTAAAA